MRGWLFSALLALAGCVDDRLERCGDLTCPTGSSCRADACATETQVAACEGSGLGDGELCVLAEATGYCLGGACRFAVCGNAIQEPTEACDDGNTANGDACNATCASATCGDGFTGPDEECDDANSDDFDTCTTTCVLATCGDGITNISTSPNGDIQLEQCDDGAGNVDPGMRCMDADAGLCRKCAVDCTFVTLSFCGDGVADPEVEQCDDRNTLACGQCNAICSARQNARQATGAIEAVAGAALTDGQTITLDDAFGTPSTVVFEFDSNATLNNAAAVRVPFLATDTAATVTTSFQTALQANKSAKGLLMTAAVTTGIDVVFLKHDRATNLPNGRAMPQAGGVTLTVQLLNGGVAGDCVDGTGCTSGLDCRSQKCIDSVCAP